LIKNGVLVAGEIVKDPSLLVMDDVTISLLKEDIPWVSRAGLKLDGAINHWQIDCKGKSCLDVGSSTGGFTQVLLHHGAREVFAIDVGTNQLHPSLRSDSRIILLEQTHILEIHPGKIPRVDLMVVDLSFISLLKVIPHIVKFVLPGGNIVLLIKPQFEVGKEMVAKGVVHDEKLRAKVVQTVCSELTKHVSKLIGVIESPITGGDGNVEYLAYAVK
jgi:23S rRNA (cytidine1920-2'-O)/16S rRNA (cytidine1409-2'-O)-methyltransferase